MALLLIGQKFTLKILLIGEVGVTSSISYCLALYAPILR